jgi:hypothetical protein
MKRYYFLSLFVLLMVTTHAVAQITVKFQKPASWTAVSLYTWGPEALGGWPGVALKDSDGWYSYTFDASFTGANLIFNNAGAGEQTVDFPITISTCLKASSTLDAGGKYDVTPVACVTGMTVKFQKPASWTAVSLYTWGPEVLGSWPGVALTETDGWYSYTFDASFTGANLIFNNAGAGEQTLDYPITASTCLQSSSTLDAGGKYDVTAVACATGGITVKVKEPSIWTSLYLYAYVNNSPIIGSWPGVALTVDANGWGSYTFDPSVTAVTFIINNNSGLQAADTYVTASSCFTSDGTTLTSVDCSTTTAVATVTASPVSIYPNPIIDKLNFVGSDNIDRVSIHSLTGQLVLSVSSLSNKSAVDVKSLKSGVYFVSIDYTTGKKLTEKIIKL